MQKHSTARTPAPKLPTDHPEQLSLPGIEPAPTKPLDSLLNRVGVTTRKHRIPLTAALVVVGLFLTGQGTIATGLLFAIALHQINAAIDARMGGDE